MIRSLFFVFCFLFPVLGFAETRIDFRAFVQSDYTHREKIPGVSSTAEAIRNSLKSLPDSGLTSSIQKNGSPAEFALFLKTLPDEKETDWSVVYLAGHQSAGGELEFTGKEKILWSRLLEGVSVPAHRRRITILDVCYAEAADLRSDIVQKMGPMLVFSSAAGEKTYEMELGARRPVDFARRYPKEMEWLQNGSPSGRVKQITFFGLMWTSAFVDNPLNTMSQPEWRSFFASLKKSAENFRRERSSKLASDIVLKGF